MHGRPCAREAFDWVSSLPALVRPDEYPVVAEGRTRSRRSGADVASGQASIGPEVVLRSLADAEPSVYWLDDPHRPPARPPIPGSTSADLVVVGGGFTGLWTALRAKERDPGRDVLLLEGKSLSWAASGRNGGFCSSSLTHGIANGAAHFPRELDTLEKLGRRNLADIEETVSAHHIDCNFHSPGELTVATEEWQLDDLEEMVQLHEDHGISMRLLDAGEAR